MHRAIVIKSCFKLPILHSKWQLSRCTSRWQTKPRKSQQYIEEAQAHSILKRLITVSLLPY